MPAIKFGISPLTILNPINYEPSAMSHKLFAIRNPSSDLVNTLRAYFKGKERVVAVYLFGSYARGLEGPKSDVDLGIVLDTSDRAVSKTNRVQYLMELGRILRKDIHPVVLNTAGEALMKQIFEKGVCVVESDLQKHALFRMTMFSKIAEFGYYRSRFQRGFIKKIMGTKQIG